ncbi:S8 family peptidase [Streptomyces sp. NRRL S-920]|uniref:S8 family peptidase n=1 Tax=Streptomyces sp. NRRL S-920 TaxID=1463921 RepID=UPI00131BB137|nr:S8 family peptidase [Streptomyces sp. NRRL S-920]
MAVISRGAAAVIAVAMSGALVAGVASADSGPRPDHRAGQGASTGPKGKNSSGARGERTTTVTLITGDRVVVGAGSRKVVRLLRGKGREQVSISVRREGGHLYVVPQDAQSLIAAGKLDRRLFDVTQLVKDKYDDAHRTSLPLIVGYRPGRVNARSGGDLLKSHARDRRTLPAIGGEAFDTPKSGTGGLWSALTGGTGTGGARMNARPAVVPAIAHVWLDAKVRPALDKSVPQIGAPTMWRAGYTGKGVKVAVLDTGVDQTHPDLKGVEVTEKNFTISPDAKDRMGHGTHVASTLAGSGARSGGKYKGVAPDVRILDGKVISEEEGAGTDSSVAAGMQWAVDSGAKVVNMSLGGSDTPGTGPLEEAVARLSDQALFVASAGNDGPEEGTLTTPGSAPDALTVGSVDKQDHIAETSSRGPNADGITKPDLTAPGVEITAAASTENPNEPGDEGYVSMSGTSMAAPHVSGSAAMLLQQHPTWTGRQVKAALTGSAKPDPTLNAHQQGAGRVDLTRAVSASVVSSPGSLSFGTQAWPHTDDKPVGKTLTYRNYGTKPVTLTLSTATADPAGRPAPAGMFTVKDTKLTVPAEGTAKTTVTANTKLGGANGTYGGTVLAEGDGQSVRTGLVVDREVESYNLTVAHLDVDGTDSTHYITTLTDRATQKKFTVPFRDGPAAVRLPKGTYALESSVYGLTTSFAVFVQPELRIGGDQKVTLDSRKAKPVAVTAPDPNARVTTSNISYDDQGAGISANWSLGSGATVRTAGLGPDSPTFNAQYNGVWKVPGAAGKKTDYRLGFTRTGSWFPGLKHTVTAAEVAEVKVGVGASATGRKGTLSATPIGANDYGPPLQPSAELKLPFSGTSYLNTKGLRWMWGMAQLDDAGEPRINYGTGPVAYKAGKRYTLNFNTGVVGPDLKADDRQGARRAGNAMDAYVLLFNDGAGHAGDSAMSGGFTRLESGGRVVAEGGPGALNAELPSASAPYRLTMEAGRAAKDTATSTKVAVAWTFTSGKTPSEPPTALPLSTVRLAPKLALNGTARAGSTLTVPLKVAGAAAGAGKVASLTVKVSYDGGRTWKAATVTTDDKGARSASVRHPATAKAVSYRVYLKDTSGNTMTETISNAYRLVP